MWQTGQCAVLENTRYGREGAMMKTNTRTGSGIPGRESVSIMNESATVDSAGTISSSMLMAAKTAPHG